MNRSLKFLSCVAAAGAVYGASLSAQVVSYAVAGQAGEPVTAGIMAGKMIAFTGGELERVIKNAPFTAQAVTTTTQVLGDGNRIVQTSETNLARDTEGRSRRELSIDKIGPWSTDSTGHVVVIRDPVAGVAYELAPDGKTATRSQMRAPAGDDHVNAEIKAKRLAEEREVRAKEMAQRETRTFSVNNSEGNAYSVIISDGGGGPAKKEALGDQMIEGVRATGTRETRTIPAGKIGNDRAIEIVSETWYSPDLQMVVQSRRSDPRTGETIYKLTNVVLGEPDATLFQVPAGVTVQDLDQVKRRLELEMQQRRRAEHPDQPPQQ